MKKNERLLQLLLGMSFIFYAVFVIWNILFKYVSPLELFSTERHFMRSYNLIPYFDLIVKGHVNALDLYGNILLFIPFGVYLSYHEENRNMFRSVLIILFVSIGFELIQFVFGIGATDVTDVINNTLGGVIGMGCCVLLTKLLKKKSRVRLLLTVCSTTAMIFVSVILIALKLAN